MDHEGHAEQRRRQIDDRDRHEGCNEKASGEDGRSVIHGEAIRDRLLAGDLTAAMAIGLDPKLLLDRAPGPPDEATIAYVRPFVERASLALSVNEAWAMLACVAVLGLLLVPFARDVKSRT